MPCSLPPYDIRHACGHRPNVVQEAFVRGGTEALQLPSDIAPKRSTAQVGSGAFAATAVSGVGGRAASPAAAPSHLRKSSLACLISVKGRLPAWTTARTLLPSHTHATNMMVWCRSRHTYGRWAPPFPCCRFHIHATAFTRVFVGDKQLGSHLPETPCPFPSACAHGSGFGAHPPASAAVQSCLGCVLLLP